MLEELVSGESHIELSVNKDETASELESKFLFGRPVSKGKPGTYIEFIGPGGEIVKSVEATSSSCKVDGDYLRAKVIHRVKKKDGKLREYYAWTQPVFTDGRWAEKKTTLPLKFPALPSNVRGRCRWKDNHQCSGYKVEGMSFSWVDHGNHMKHFW